MGSWFPSLYSPGLWSELSVEALRARHTSRLDRICVVFSSAYSQTLEDAVKLSYFGVASV